MVGSGAWRWRRPRRSSRRIGHHAADALAKLDLKYKLVGKGLPKNYQAVAKRS